VVGRRILSMAGHLDGWTAIWALRTYCDHRYCVIRYISHVKQYDDDDDDDDADDCYDNKDNRSRHHYHRQTYIGLIHVSIGRCFTRSDRRFLIIQYLCFTFICNCVDFSPLVLCRNLFTQLPQEHTTLNCVYG